MAARSRFFTSTVIDSEYLVPWLSAEGPLAYSPTKLPGKDYFFQYTWILPGIFNPQLNLREHRYFGSPLKDVVVKTLLSNFRITTFFASESEAKIVDPSQISEVQAVGCEVDFVPPMD